MLTVESHYGILECRIATNVKVLESKTLIIVIYGILILLLYVCPRVLMQLM